MSDSNVAASSSHKRRRSGNKVPAAPPVPKGQKRKYGLNAVSSAGKSWYKSHPKAKYFFDECIDRASLARAYPRVLARLEQVGMGFVFNRPTDCNLHLVRELYANWNPDAPTCLVVVRGSDVILDSLSLTGLLGVPTRASP